ncbi:MAG: helix-turn-helix transcriptional regulator [Spirochaetales bacterium]|nr:helix-turn-helix transcriptional regulator [Spirochaetales bacterium]
MLQINSAEHHICHKEWFWDTSMTGWQDTDLWYVSRGSGEIRTPRGTFPLYRGVCFILKGDERYIAGHDPEAALQVYAVHFDSDPERDFSRYQVRNPDFMDELCRRIVEHHQNNDARKARLWLQGAFSELECSRGETGRTPDVKLRLSEAVRQAALRNFSGVSVGDMAFWFGSSREHFSRIFLREKGMTAQDFLLSRRIAMACSLLHSTNYPVSMISDKLGYSDVAFFSRQFKQKMKVSPSQYRSGKM